MKVVITVFYRYTPRINDHYRTQGDLYFHYLKQAYPYLDGLYIADAGWNIPEEDLHPNTHKYTEDYRSHWHYLNELTKMALADGATEILYLDPDIFLYNPVALSRCFGHDVTAILDNSGTTTFWPANEYRAERKRLTPYMTFINADLLRGVPVDFTPVAPDGQFKYDSMGLLTEQIVALKPEIRELRDDRSSIYLEDATGKISSTSNLDGPPYLWSLPADRTEPTGYYHVRNSSIGLSLLDEFQADKPAYDRRKEITPFREMMRLLMWQWVCDIKTKQLYKYEHLFWPVLDEYGVSKEIWYSYEQAFLRYHSWLEAT
jgi:hypothetical protein